MLPCNDDLSLSALRWNGLEKSSKCQGWYWSQTSNYSRSSWNFWVFNTKVQHYLNRRIIQYQVMIFQVQPAVLEFNHRKQSSEIALQENRERAQQMVLPIEPHYRIQHDITYVQQVYLWRWFSFWLAQVANPSIIGNKLHITQGITLNSCFNSFFTTFAYPPVLFGSFVRNEMSKMGRGGVNMV